MRVVGLYTANTTEGFSLKNGGTCLIENGIVKVAISEERLTRKKYMGGFKLALGYCLDALQAGLNDLDLVVCSNCCDEALSCEFEPSVKGIPFDKLRFIPSHHLSHAYSAFMVSPFEDAIVMVNDQEGNIIEPRIHPEHRRNRLEQSSYYVGVKDRITLLERDFDQIGEVGFGEVYNYFTRFLGWPHWVYSGHTMALSGYGQAKNIGDEDVFVFKDGKVKCLLESFPENPCRSILRFGEEFGLKLGEPRQPGAEITEKHADVAAYLQRQIEKALIYKVRHLCKSTGLKNLCIAGGLGLNVIANNKLLSETPIESIFIQPAASDKGQCLGNALYGYHHLLNNPREFVMNHVYWGRSYAISEIEHVLRQYSDRIIIEKVPTPALKAAELLAKGNIIGWFQGGSEFGPRALGHRSILADPRDPQIPQIINEKIKLRESFRPYAPSILEEHYTEYFELECPSPFMTLVAMVKSDKRTAIPAVTHVDGTARIQTVNEKNNGIYHELIYHFYKLTGIPVILNTSFNLKGEPIIETPKDAIEDFLKMGLDYLFIENLVISKPVSQNHT